MEKLGNKEREGEKVEKNEKEKRREGQGIASEKDETRYAHSFESYCRCS